MTLNRKDITWQLILAAVLILISASLYFLHYILFKDIYHIFFYLLSDIAFIPIEVLIVTIIIHQLLSQRERGLRMNKMNMIVGAFFSEVGTELLTYFSDLDPDLDSIKKMLVLRNDWNRREFIVLSSNLKKHSFSGEFGKANLSSLGHYLKGKREFLLRLLENPNLLEHESFTSLLWAVFHLTEELVNRKDLSRLSRADSEHLSYDIKRAYELLVNQWLDYMLHLKTAYPYLFSLAMRTNPFDQTASVEFK